MVDSDGDLIPDYCDPNPNCPRGLDQGDDDNDGVCNGLDVACPCSPIGGAVLDAKGDSDGDGACDACSGASTFCQNFCLANRADTCPGKKNVQAQNANFLSEDTHGAMTLGDACEPVPVPLIDTQTQITSSTLLGTSSGGSGSGNWLLDKYDERFRLSGFNIDPIGSSAAPLSTNLTNGTVGTQVDIDVDNSDYRTCLFGIGVSCDSNLGRKDVLAVPGKPRSLELFDDFWHRIELTRKTGTDTWTLLSPDARDGLITYGFAHNSRQFRWNWENDFAAWVVSWGASINLQQPSDHTADNITTRLWAHAGVDELGATFLNSVTGYHPKKSNLIPAGQQGNHYQDSQFLFAKVRHQWSYIPMYKPKPWLYDRPIEAIVNPADIVSIRKNGVRLQAEILLHMNTGVGQPSNVAALQSNASTFDASARVSSTLLAQKENGHHFLNAVEADGALGLNNPHLYVLSPDATTISDVVRVRGGQFLGTGDRYVPLAQKGVEPTPGSPAAVDAADWALVQSAGQMAEQTAQQVEAFEGDPLNAKGIQGDGTAFEVASAQTTALRTSSPVGRHDFVTTYTKARNKLFVVGGTSLRSGQALGDVWMFRSNVWQQVRTSLVVGRPLAASYSFRDDRLWLVDEVLVGRATKVRVLAIDPETGAHQIFGTWTRSGTFEDVWLTLDLDGSLLLTSSSSSENRHVVTRIAFLHLGPQVDRQVSRPGVLAFAPVVDPTGYAFAVSPGDKLMPPLTRYPTLGGYLATWSSVGGTL